MENKEDFINKVCKEKDFQSIVVETFSNAKDRNKEMGQVLRSISNNSKLTEDEKNKIYQSIFEYIDNANKMIQKNIEIIYRAGCEDIISILDLK